MSQELSEKSGVFLLQLVFSGETPKKSTLDPGYRAPLVEMGLIALEKRGRAEVMVPTDAAWDWVAAHLDMHIAKTKPTAAITAVLARLREFLSRRGLALADFIRPSAEEAAPAAQLEDRIRAAYLARTGGQLHQRVRLTELRAVLADAARPTLDAELRRLSASGRIALLSLDDRSEISAADKRDALELSGVPVHVMYLEA